MPSFNFLHKSNFSDIGFFWPRFVASFATVSTHMQMRVLFSDKAKQNDVMWAQMGQK